MKKPLKFSLFAVVGAGLALLAQSAAAAPEEAAANDLSNLSLTRPKEGGGLAHIAPTKDFAAARAQALGSVNPRAGSARDVAYYGGKVMTAPTVYAIYWAPPKLQNGAATGWSTAYQNLQTQFLTDFSGSGLAKNNTQYYQAVSGVKTAIGSTTKVGGVYLDTTAYPASGCKDSATPAGCLSDAQLQAEIKKVITLKGWPASGINNLYFIYTAKGEGSCLGSDCANVIYCGYHSAYGTAAAPTLYAHVPYANDAGCHVPKSPNNNIDADSAANISSHELIEAITDPLVGFATVYGPPLAWYNATYGEIGDICNGQVGTNSYGGGTANQSWNGHLYELQMEYSNTKHACVQTGP